MILRPRVAHMQFLLVAVFGFSTFQPLSLYASDHFRPVSAEELAMKSEPLAPGAPAIILYRQVDRDDNGMSSHEDNYVRIKILTEEGRKYADVEIPFVKGSDEVSNTKPVRFSRTAQSLALRTGCLRGLWSKEEA